MEKIDSNIDFKHKYFKYKKKYLETSKEHKLINQSKYESEFLRPDSNYNYKPVENGYVQSFYLLICGNKYSYDEMLIFLKKKYWKLKDIYDFIDLKNNLFFYLYAINEDAKKKYSIMPPKFSKNENIKKDVLYDPKDIKKSDLTFNELIESAYIVPMIQKKIDLFNKNLIEIESKRLKNILVNKANMEKEEVDKEDHFYSEKNRKKKKIDNEYSFLYNENIKKFKKEIYMQTMEDKIKEIDIMNKEENEADIKESQKQMRVFFIKKSSVFRNKYNIIKGTEGLEYPLKNITIHDYKWE